MLYQPYLRLIDMDNRGFGPFCTKSVYSVTDHAEKSGVIMQGHGSDVLVYP